MPMSDEPHRLDVTDGATDLETNLYKALRRLHDCRLSSSLEEITDAHVQAALTLTAFESSHSE